MRIALRGRGTDYERGGQGDYYCIIPLTSPLSESHGVGGQVKNPPERIPITTSETGRTSRGNRTTQRDDKWRIRCGRQKPRHRRQRPRIGTRKRRRHSPKSLSTTARKNWDHRCAGRGGGERRRRSSSELTPWARRCLQPEVAPPPPPPPPQRRKANNEEGGWRKRQ